MDRGILQMTKVQEKQPAVEKKQVGWEEVPELSITSKIIYEEDELLEKKMDQLLQRIDQIEKQLQQINDPQKLSTITNPLSKQSVDTIRYYVNIGKMAGYIIETIAAGAMTVIDSVSSSSKDKAFSRTPVKNTADNEIDITGIIQSVGALIKNLSVSDATEIAPPNQKIK